MNNVSSKLTVGIVDFSTTTLLLLGDENSFQWFATQIKSRRKVELSQCEDNVDTNVKINITPTSTSGRLIRLNDGYEWDISEEESKRFIDLLRALIRHPKACHTYLDPEESSEIDVIASKGEYNRDIIFSQPTYYYETSRE